MRFIYLFSNEHPVISALFPGKMIIGMFEEDQCASQTLALALQLHTVSWLLPSSIWTSICSSSLGLCPTNSYNLCFFKIWSLPSQINVTDVFFFRFFLPALLPPASNLEVIMRPTSFIFLLSQITFLWCFPVSEKMWFHVFFHFSCCLKLNGNYLCS